MYTGGEAKGGAKGDVPLVCVPPLVHASPFTLSASFSMTSSSCTASLRKQLPSGLAGRRRAAATAVAEAWQGKAVKSNLV